MGDNLPSMSETRQFIGYEGRSAKDILRDTVSEAITENIRGIGTEITGESLLQGAKIAGEAIGVKTGLVEPPQEGEETAEGETEGGIGGVVAGAALGLVLDAIGIARSAHISHDNSPSPVFSAIQSATQSFTQIGGGGG
jgi:hypothetical protein